MEKEAKRVFVVEDQDDVREMVRMVLENLAGHKVTVASSGEEALEMLKNTPPIDTFVVDITLTGMSGIDFIQKIREIESYRNIPTVATTGLAHPENIPGIKEAGRVLAKPYSIEELMAAIEECGQN